MHEVFEVTEDRPKYISRVGRVHIFESGLMWVH